MSLSTQRGRRKAPVSAHAGEMCFPEIPRNSFGVREPTHCTGVHGGIGFGSFLLVLLSGDFNIFYQTDV